MNIWEGCTECASAGDVKAVLGQFKHYDKDDMLSAVIELPSQITQAIEAADSFNEGEIPLDQSRIHLFGIGGSGIAGDLLRDMFSPRKLISIHRGTLPPRDRCGVVAASYSGNTREIIDCIHLITGGLKSVIIETSGGKLSEIAYNLSIPMWKLPTGYQPRAALGWSMAFLLAIMVRWKIVFKSEENKLASAAAKIGESLAADDLSENSLSRYALPISQLILGKNALIFHSLKCTGAARRFAAQINENGKQPAFAVLMPEGLHNAIEGISGGHPNEWTLIYFTDPDDPEFLRESLGRSMEFIKKKGFNVVVFPAIGENQYELTLARILLGDLVSVFLAVLRGIDPTSIPAIETLKSGKPF